MTLTEARKGDQCLISAIEAQGKARARLDSLGFVIGETVLVMASSYAGMILDVKGSRLAVCKSVADMIKVSKS